MLCKRFTQCTVSAAPGAASLVGLHVSKCIVSLELGRVDPSKRESLNTARVRLVEPEMKIPPECQRVWSHARWGGLKKQNPFCWGNSPDTDRVRMDLEESAGNVTGDAACSGDQALACSNNNMVVVVVVVVSAVQTLANSISPLSPKIHASEAGELALSINCSQCEHGDLSWIRRARIKISWEE